MTNIRRALRVSARCRYAGGSFAFCNWMQMGIVSVKVEKYYDYFGWNIFKNVEMIFNLFDNGDRDW